jgi:hypothetical protein
MNIPTQDELLERIEKFCAKHDMAETRFGREAVNNPAFIRGLRDGKSPTLETLNRLKAFMARIDDLATLRVPAAPLGGDAEEIPLPFGNAPVSTTGASSAISLPTLELHPAQKVSSSSHCSTGSADAEEGAGQ